MKCEVKLSESVFLTRGSFVFFGYETLEERKNELFEKSFCFELLMTGGLEKN